MKTRPKTRAAFLTLLALPLAVALGGCASVKAGPRPDGMEPGGTVIPRDRIEKMRVRTALEVLERGASHLVIQRTREGSPVRIYHRGIDSFLLGSEIAVVIDGALVNRGVNALDNIPSASVEYIQILSAREGATKYGAAAGNGVIIVRTNSGLA